MKSTSPPASLIPHKRYLGSFRCHPSRYALHTRRVPYPVPELCYSRPIFSFAMTGLRSIADSRQQLTTTSEQENWWEDLQRDRTPQPAARERPQSAPFERNRFSHLEIRERPQSTYLERSSPQVATWRAQNALKEHFARQQAQVESSNPGQRYGGPTEAVKWKQKDVSEQVGSDKGDKQRRPNSEGVSGGVSSGG